MILNWCFNVRNCDFLKVDFVFVKILLLVWRDFWFGSDFLYNNGCFKFMVRLCMFVVYMIVLIKGILYCCVGEGIKIEVLVVVK